MSRTFRIRFFMRTIAVLVLASLPSVASAAVVSTVFKLIVKGISLTSDVISVGGPLKDMFAGQDLTGLENTPLYTAGGSSPTLTFNASDTHFKLLLQQFNNVEEFHDDDNAVLEGTTSIETAFGKTEAWKWKLTIKADIFTVLGVDSAFIQAGGFVQHVFKPHPDIEEFAGDPMPYDLTNTHNSVGKLTKSENKKELHAPIHYDYLAATINSTYEEVGLNSIADFNLVLEANHVVPEPSMVVIGTLFGLGGLMAKRRMKKLR